MLLALSLVVFCGNIFRFMAFFVMSMEVSASLLSASFSMSPISFPFLFSWMIFLDDFLIYSDDDTFTIFHFL
jgi:hypothetical protein